MVLIHFFVLFQNYAPPASDFSTAVIFNPMGMTQIWHLDQLYLDFFTPKALATAQHLLGFTP